MNTNVYDNNDFDIDIPLASDLRAKTFRQNAALKKCVQRTVERIKYAADNHQTYAVMDTAVSVDGNNIDVGKQAVLTALKPYGYREYTEPVYSGGVRQDLDFITWME